MNTKLSLPITLIVPTYVSLILLIKLRMTRSATTHILQSIVKTLEHDASMTLTQIGVLIMTLRAVINNYII